MAIADTYGLFWDSVNGDRMYNSDSFEMWLKKFFTSGVFADELEVTASNDDMSVNVSGGYANVDGKVRFFTSTTRLTIEAAHSTYPRIDTIVVRRDNINRTITLAVVKGEYSGNTPVATAPVRTSDTYELVLAEVYVGAGVIGIFDVNVADKRTDTDVCGYVVGTVEEIDFGEITRQWQAFFFDWFEQMKDQLSEDAAGHLQLEVDALDSRLTAEETTSTTHTGQISTLETDVTNLQAYRTLLSGTQLSTTASTKTLNEDPANFLLADVRIYTSGHNTHFLMRGNSLMEQLSGSYTPKYFYIRTSESSGQTVTITPTSATTFTIKHNGSGNMYVSVTGISRIAE